MGGSLAALYAGLMLVVLARNTAMGGGDLLFLGVVVAVMASPLLVLASKLSVESRLFADRVEVQGVLRRPKTLMLADCSGVSCGAGRAFSRNIVLYFGLRGRLGTKVVLSNNRDGFWDAAEALREIQGRYEWQLSYGLMRASEGHFWLPDDERGRKWV